MAQYFEQSKITYQQLVMEQIKVIQTICSKELRDSTKTVKNLVGEQTIEAEDTRHSFLQSIRMLGSLLSPYFGKSEVKTNFNKFCELYDMQLKKAILDKEFKKEVCDTFSIDINKIDNELKTNEGLKNEINLYFLNFKITEGMAMFEGLVNLFKENDFLGNESFSESSEVDDSLEAIDDSEDE